MELRHLIRQTPEGAEGRHHHSPAGASVAVTRTLSIALASFMVLAAVPAGMAAEDSQTSAAKAGAGDVSALLEQGKAAFQEGRVAEAVRFFEAVLAADANNAEAAYRLALARETLGEVESAIEAYLRLREGQPGERWARLASSRLASLTYGLAVDRYRQAERYATRGRYAEAMEALRSVHRWGLPPGLDHIVRDRYYAYLVRDVAAGVRVEMARANAYTLGVVPLLAGVGEETIPARTMRLSSAESSAARDLTERLAAGLVAAGITETSVISLAETTARDLFNVGLALAGETGRADELLRGLDCLLVGAIGEHLVVRLIEVQRRYPLWSATRLMLGTVPPALRSEVWQNLVANTRPDKEFRLELWLDRDSIPADAPTQVHYRAGQSCYVTILLVREDGSLCLLLPATPDEDNFVLAGEHRVLTVEPLGHHGVVGAVLIASYSPLPLPREAAGAWLPYTAALNAVLDLRAELAEREEGSWAQTYWKWRVMPSSPDGAKP